VIAIGLTVFVQKNISLLASKLIQFSLAVPFFQWYIILLH